jgi:hypothetical protein
MWGEPAGGGKGKEGKGGEYDQSTLHAYKRSSETFKNC